jgi:hypothetical protein
MSMSASSHISSTHLLCDLFHVPDYEVVAIWVVERGEAVGVLEGDEMRLLRVVVEVHRLEAPDLLARHL